jgi:hypothetical protein
MRDKLIAYAIVIALMAVIGGGGMWMLRAFTSDRIFNSIVLAELSGFAGRAEAK